MKRILPVQILLVALLAGLITMLLWNREPEGIPLEKIEKAMEDTLAQAEVQKVGDMRLKAACGLQVSDYEEVFYYYPSNTMGVDELLMIRLKDKSQADAVRSAMEKRLDVQKKAFDGYGVDQFDILGRAKIYQNGTYMALVVSDDVDAWMQTIKEALKE